MSNGLTRLVIATAFLEIVWSLIKILQLLAEGDIAALPSIYRIATIILFSGLALQLAFADRRPISQHLAAAFLLVASGFTTQIFRQSLDVGSSELLSRVFLRLPLESLLQYEVWSFFSLFMRKRVKSIWHLVTILKISSLVVGVVLIFVNLTSDVLPSELVGRLLQTSDNNLFEILVYGTPALLPLLSLGYYFVCPKTQRRQVFLFLLGMSFSVPMVLVILMSSVSPLFLEFITSPGPSSIFITLVNILILFVPLVTAYSILIADDNGIIRRLGNQKSYSLAGNLVFGMMLIPIVGFIRYLYNIRETTIAEIYLAPEAYLLAICALATILLLRYRVALREEIVTRFFRTPFKLEDLSALLARRIAEVDNFLDLIVECSDLLKQRMSLSEVEPFLLNPVTLTLTSTAHPTHVLNLSEEDAVRLTKSEGLLTSDPITNRSGQIVMCIRDQSNRLIATILISEKLNEDPFNEDELKFLEEILDLLTKSAGPKLLLNDHPKHRFLIPFEVAKECELCSTLHSSSASSCPNCNGPVVAAPVPRILNKKYLLQERLGMGAFGNVYLGTDETLGRQIAVKTLPGTAGEEQQDSLKQEAKMMANMSHKNLAILYGLEFWREVPLLMVEYLPGGTLLDHIGSATVDAKQLCESLCHAIHYTHEQGVLHLDVKPSNIGFTHNGDLKLLDFGTAHITRSLLTSMSEESSEPLVNLDFEQARKSTISGRLVGTPLYMSPEALQGDRPSKKFDLWSLSVVLAETLGNSHPFASESWPKSYFSIIHAKPTLTGLSPELTSVFARLFAQTESERPESALEISELITSAIHLN